MNLPSRDKVSKMTPMIRQYYDLKSQVPDTILLFRMGDFYEIFGDDAEEVAPVLQLVLTSRERGDQERIPFCGVPHHSMRGYWLKLLKKGYKIAIADQVEDPKEAKGLVKREITRILTPGSLDDLEGLVEEVPNYLLAAYEDPTTRLWSVALADASTGEIKAGNYKSMQDVFAQIERHKVREVLVRDFHRNVFKQELAKRAGMADVLVEPLPESPLRDKALQTDMLTRIFGKTNLSDLPCGEVEGGAAIVAALCKRLENLKMSTRQFLTIRPLTPSSCMYLDEIAARDLELFVTVRRGETEGSLFKEINRTLSPMGARELRGWLMYPLTSAKLIKERQAAIKKLKDDGQKSIVEFRRIFGKTPDLIRLATRVHNASATPIELAAVRDTLKKSQSLEAILKEKSYTSQPYDRIARELNMGLEPLTLLDRALTECPTVLGKGTGVIQKGFDKQLDEINEFAASGSQKVSDYEAELRKKHEISSLKIKTHKTFGLLIEVTKSNLHKVPDYFIRRQTMVNCERFMTDELKELSDSLLTAEEKAVALERKLYAEILESTSKFRNELAASANAMATLDVLQSLAWKANESDWCLPVTLDESDDAKFDIKASRHPVVESFVGKHEFVPNDVSLWGDQRHLLITGPNMAGKSTIMRQTALIAILHQMGSYIPAQKAELCVFDRVFTRVGASDDLSRGQSTFMVEMTEAANVLRQATSSSLVILDEVGRGTSTEDGLALASAILEDLSERVRCRSMFATHYHELAQLADQLEDVSPMQTLVRESQAGVEFTHQLIAGAADSSYGIEVARLAGVPENVIEKAQKWLAHQQSSERGNGSKALVPRTQEESVLPLERLFAAADTELAKSPANYVKISDTITSLKIDRTTPLEALNLLSELQELLIKSKQNQGANKFASE